MADGGDDPQAVADTEKAIRILSERIDDYGRLSSDKRVQYACRDAELVARFVVLSREVQEKGRGIRDALLANAAYVGAFRGMYPKIVDFSGSLAAIDRASKDHGDSQNRESLVRELAGLAIELLGGLDIALDAFVAVVKEWAGTTADRADVRTKAIEEANELRGHVTVRQRAHRTEVTEQEQLKKRGDAGAEKISVHYAQCAAEEAKAANKLRAATAGLLVAITIGAVMIHFVVPGPSLGTELLRLSATIPIAVLAGYLAKESARHRRLADWARRVEIAMRTMPDYVAPLGKDGVELRRALGARVFALAGDPDGESADVDLFEAVPKVLDRLERFVRLVKEVFDRRGGGS